MSKYQLARELGEKGFSVKEIAEKLGISEKTATLYLIGTAKETEKTGKTLDDFIVSHKNS